MNGHSTWRERERELKKMLLNWIKTGKIVNALNVIANAVEKVLCVRL